MKKTLTTRLLNVFCRLYLRPAKLGRNSFVLPPFRITNPKSLFIGDNTRIGQYAFWVLCKAHNQRHYTPRFTIGNNVQIGNDLFVGCLKNITIGDNVLISSRVFIADTTHDYKDVKRPVIEQNLTEGQAVTIEDNAFIGVNTCILPGICIGKNAVVGAGAVVTRDVQSFTVVAGNPAVTIKRYDFEKKTWISARQDARK
jgi:acetyltransferase-like isoleucine patch superfamily enzyme